MNSFMFINESGVLQNDPNQPLFCLGLLKLHDTSRLYRQVKEIRDRLVDSEFKFTKVKDSNFHLYVELLNAYLNYKDGYFCAFILDKLRPGMDVKRYFSDTWDAYIGYSKLLVRNNLRDDICCVISDYLDRPSYARNFYEDGIRGVDQNKIFNVTMLESHASLMIQVVDVLTGCVSYEFRQQRYGAASAKRSKIELVKHLRRSLGRDTLAANFSVNNPNYFSVWEFTP